MVYDNSFGPVTNTAIPLNRTYKVRVYRIATAHGIGALILAIYITYRANRFDELVKAIPNLNSISESIIQNIKVSCFTLSSLFGVEFVVCIVLLMGAAENSPKLHIPWLIYTPLFRISTFCFLIVTYNYLPVDTAFVVFSLIIYLLIIGLAFFSTYIVYKNYKQLSDSKRHSMLTQLL